MDKSLESVGVFKEKEHGGVSKRVIIKEGGSRPTAVVI